MNTITTLDIPTFMNNVNQRFIGHQRLMDRMMENVHSSNDTGYPPYNVIKNDDDNFVIELAVAGFGMDDLSITDHNGELTIEGTKNKDPKDSDNYLHRGISSRKFRRTFNLADHVNVTDATVKDGILSVTLVREVPEELKPRVIDINYAK
jgi:molecular chaperone IbpA